MTSGIVIANIFFFFLVLYLCVLLRWPVRCATIKHRGEAEKTATFIIPTGSGGRRNSMPNRTTWESLLGCQEAEDQEGGEMRDTVLVGVSVGKARQGCMSSLVG